MKELKVCSMDRKVIKISIILLIVVVVISLICVFSLSPKLKLETGEKTINVFDEYTGISYNATSFGKDVTDMVLIDGTVDNQHVGKYNITYSIRNTFFKTTKKLTVNVVDTIAPNLSLIGENEYNVCALDRYIEPGYTAIDNYDGDITGNVEKKFIKDDEIEYKVSDSSGNNSNLNRKLIIGDNNGPELKLKGDSTVYVVKGSEYTEKGATAVDNCDGDLTKGINIEGSVNTKKNGTYEIKYSVKDLSGNESTLVRKVVVQEKKQESKSNSTTNNSQNTSGVIYLTFDDGPCANTKKVLDILDKHGVKATFFVTNQIKGYQNMIGEEFKRGHTIGIHTLTHQWNIYNSLDSYWNDFDAMNNIVEQQTGKRATILRFPGGTSNRKASTPMSQIVESVNSKGYKYFDWNVSVEDAGACAYKSNKQSCVINNFKTYLKPNRSNIVLMHDLKVYTANGLDEMITYAKAKGYTFKAIDDTTEPVHFNPYR